MPKYTFKNTNNIRTFFPKNYKKKTISLKILKKGKIFLKRIKILKMLPGFFLIGTILFIGNKLVINAPSNTILNVQFEKKAISYYDNPDLFSKISNFLSGKNIILESSKIKTLTTSLKNKYPLIQEISIKKSAPNTALVYIKYRPPSFIILLSGEARGSINQNFFPIPLTSTLLKDNTVPSLHLPTYYNKDFPLSGFFFKISEENLTSHIKSLKKHLSPKKIIYLPGGSKYEVHRQDKIIFFDGTKDLQAQIKNFLLLLGNQDKLKPSIRQRQKADVGSLSGAVILTP